MEGTANVRIGVAGWSYKDWEGKVYPPGLKRKMHPAEYLAQYLDVIEINTSFYGHIKPEWARKWCRLCAGVNPEFRFSAKLHRSLTHSPNAVVEPTSAETIRPDAEEERLAREGLDAVAEQGMLAALLIQFPISFKNTAENREYLHKLLERFRQYPDVVEVRHASWNNMETLGEFAARGVAFCNIDQPYLGRALRRTDYATSDLGYVRLHGRNYQQWFEHEKPHDRYNYLYKKEELEGWKSKIQRVAEKTKTTYVVANNHFQGKAVVNALQLQHLLSDKRVRAPEVLVESYPELEPIAMAAGESPPLSLQQKLTRK